jgi:ZIP family zinc transporter
MIYVVITEIIPTSQSNESKNIMTLYTMIGFTIMMMLDILL